MTVIDTLAVIPPTVVTGGPIEAVWGNDVVAALAEHEYKINSMLPVGTIWQYAGQAVPPGWAFCDGSPHSTTDPNYAALFAAIGYLYGGAGDSFNLPDMRGRTPVGVSPADAAWARVGVANPMSQRNGQLLVHTHGMKSHWHDMKNHVHYDSIQTEAGHVHTTNFGNVPVSGGYAVEGEPSGWPSSGAAGILFGNPPVSTGMGSRSPYGWASKSLHVYLGYPTTASNSGHAHGINYAGPSDNSTTPPNDNTTDQAGTAPTGADANLPPYMTLNFIIRLGWP
jgi:microcystin-dependent protein